MKPIYPIGEAECRPHYGKPVCVIMKDGGEIIGTLAGIKDGKLILGYDVEEAAPQGAGPSKKSKRPTKKKATGSKKDTAQAAANGNTAWASASPASPLFPTSQRVVLDLSLTALLFALI